MENIKVGDQRTFSFKEKAFVVKEILDNVNFTMFWTWSDSVCPHCKKHITNTVQHKFSRIEILVEDGVADQDITIDKILLLGDTYDNRKMLITSDKYDEVFSFSKDFKKFMK